MYKILVERFVNGFVVATVLEFEFEDFADIAYDNLRETKPASGCGIVTILTKLY